MLGLFKWPVRGRLKRGELANESLEDALIDLLVYAGIALVLYREQA